MAGLLDAATGVLIDGKWRSGAAAAPVRDKFTQQTAAEVHLGTESDAQDAVTSAKAMQVSFELPGARSELKAKAEIAWQDQRGNVGIRFVKLPQHQQRTLQLWLAQQYFAN